MIKCYHRTNLVCEQFIDQLIIEIEATLIHFALTLRKDARPGNRETIGIQLHTGHQRDIFSHMMVVICGDIASCSLINRSWFSCECVPDAGTAPILTCCAFYLISRGSGPPEKICRESWIRESFFA